MVVGFSNTLPITAMILELTPTHSQINLIKITSLTPSPLLICHIVGDPKKHHYCSHVSDPMS